MRPAEVFPARLRGGSRRPGRRQSIACAAAELVTCMEKSIRASNVVSPSRREALKQIGAGVGALATAGCMPAPDRCGGPPAPAATGPLASVDHFVVLMMENRS